MALPFLSARATRTRIQPGASLSDVMAVAEMYWIANGRECSDPSTTFRILTTGLTSGSLTIRQESAPEEVLDFETRSDLLRIFAERPELGTCRRLAFTFVLGGPPRATLVVEFGNDGQVVRTIPPYVWD
jgi:hypothetical protein